MSDMLVSVLCLTYNHERFIRNTLDGFVQQQTSFAFEVLIHDDASTDKTPDIVREYAQKYPDIIKFIAQTENQYSKGIPITNTFLLPRACGKYLAYCEGDDYWDDPTKLQRQVDFLESHEEYVACVHNSMKLDCETGKIALMFPRTEDCEITFEDSLHAWPRTYQTSSLVMRREFRLELPSFFHIAKGYGDWPLGIWLAINGKVHFINRPMSVYRYHSSDSSWMKTKRDVVATLQNVVDMLEGVREHVSGERLAILNDYILERKYQILEYKRDFKIMKQPPYRTFYQQESLKRKIKLNIKQYAYPFVQLYKKISKKGKDT